MDEVLKAGAVVVGAIGVLVLLAPVGRREKAILVELGEICGDDGWRRRLIDLLAANG